MQKFIKKNDNEVSFWQSRFSVNFSKNIKQDHEKYISAKRFRLNAKLDIFRNNTKIMKY